MAKHALVESPVRRYYHRTRQKWHLILPDNVKAVSDP